jgi:two-component system chemotaxis response regulator CheY
MTANRKTVLMIDDSPELLEVAQSLFDSKEFIFLTAKDGAEGLFKAKNQKFDVVICDFKMPKMDGATFVKEFRRTVKSPTPILLYSGHLDGLPEDLREIKNLYRLAKPCQSYELIERVRSLAGGRASPVVQATTGQIRFEAGSFLFREGERGSDGFILHEGSIEILKEFPDGSEVVLDTLAAGDFLGNWAPADGQFRFYSARSKTLVALTVVPQTQIAKELDQLPTWAKSIVKGQYNRLHAAYQQLKKLKKAS